MEHMSAAGTWKYEDFDEYAEWSLVQDDYLKEHLSGAVRELLIPVREQIAWAAGFYDGEGSCSAPSRPKAGSHGDYIAVIMTIGQNERQPLERFQGAVGGIGAIYGPRVSATGANPRYDWQTGKFEDVQAVAAMLWPFLCEPKRAQIAAALTAWHESWQARTERRNFCLRGHDKRVTGFIRPSNGCKECKRLGYWRSQPPGRRPVRVGKR